jgi:uncharacterized membrane protein
VVAFDSAGLADLARRAGAVIELVPQVGDFVPTGTALFRVYGDGQAISDGVLRQAVALGQERTLEQDPSFAFRIIVDVACKALSPAVNDPTTAVLAIDCVHELLGAVGARHLDEGRVLDAQGKLRLVYRTPQWSEFVQLAVTEIRLFGKDSIQVARRLHAMINSLIAAVPPARTALLVEELDLLQRTTERHFEEAEDRAMAHVGDQQGVGGAGSGAPERDGAVAGVDATVAGPREPGR